MIEVGSIYTIDIISNDTFGNGIAKIDNFVIFVKNAVKKDKLEIEITDKNKKYAKGKIINIIEKSPDRVEISCPYYSTCGGCSFLHMNYELEAKTKEEYISKMFPEHSIDVYHTKENNYRSKVTLHVKNNEIGFYEEKSNNIISFDECLLLNNELNKIYKLLKKIDLSNVKEIMIRMTNDNDILISITGTITKKDTDLLISNNNSIKSIYIDSKLVYGNPYIINNISNKKYTVYPNSFFQVNLEGMINIYDIVKQYAGSGNKLLDLYCGTGTIGIYLSDNFKEVTGIEIVKEAIENAKINMKLNNINNIKFICDDASIIEKDNYDVVVLDPPRSGLSDNAINELIKLNSNKIVYVSCNPNTLKRDINKLNMYDVKDISLVHMFPRTSHMECVVRLQRKNI